MLEKSKQFRDLHTFEEDDYTRFKKQIEEQGGFYSMHWCGSALCETKIKDETKATIRLIPFDRKSQAGNCICCGEASQGRVIFARAY
jgi:prolyl-tRNA synthetase